MPGPSPSLVKGPSRLYLGIDPGAQGGLAFLQGTSITAIPMPETLEELWDWFEKLVILGRGEIAAVIEQVGGWVGPKRRKDGSQVDGAPGSHMFKFGQSYGRLQAFLTAAYIPYEEVHPKRWQKGLGISRERGETKGVWKGRLKEKGQELYPGLKITLKTSDAI